MAIIPDGEDVSAFLNQLGPSVWISAVGVVHDARVTHGAIATGEAGSIEGPAMLLSLQGPASGPLMAVLKAPPEAGGVIHGVWFLGGKSAGVTYAVTGGGAPVVVAPSTAKTPPKPRPTVDDEADELPVQGDRIDHFVFGLCDVMVVTGERFKIREIGGGKLREIHVGPFRLSKPVVVDGKRVFKLVKRS